MSKAISEETKQKISELYKTSDLSTASISQALGVSERTAQRYKNYNGLDTRLGRLGLPRLVRLVRLVMTRP